MKASEIYNYAEVVIWPAIAAVIAIAGWKHSGRSRARFMIAAVVLVIFGASDWFEANTGNEWWHPWWLLLWKASCVIVLLLIGFDAWRKRGISPVTPPREDSTPVG